MLKKELLKTINLLEQEIEKNAEEKKEKELGDIPTLSYHYCHFCDNRYLDRDMTVYKKLTSSPNFGSSWEKVYICEKCSTKYLSSKRYVNINPNKST